MSPLKQNQWTGSAWSPPGGGVGLPPYNGKPGPTTTGARGNLTPYSGDITVTVAGTVLENLDITGKITVNAANVTIRNCRIRGIVGTASRGLGLVNFLHASASGLLEECTLIPDTRSVLWEGVAGHHFTARRCNVGGITDGFGAKNSNSGQAGVDLGVVIEDCWVHDFYFQHDSYHSDGYTHNDGVQIHTGAGVIVRRNFIEATSIDPESTTDVPFHITSCVIVNGPAGTTWGTVEVRENWLDGAVSHVNGGAGNIDSWTLAAYGNICSNKVSYEIVLNPKYTAPGLPTSTGPDTNNGNVRSTGVPITVHRVAA